MFSTVANLGGLGGSISNLLRGPFAICYETLTNQCNLFAFNVFYISYVWSLVLGSLHPEPTVNI